MACLAIAAFQMGICGFGRVVALLTKCGAVSRLTDIKSIFAPQIITVIKGLYMRVVTTAAVKSGTATVPVIGVISYIIPVIRVQRKCALIIGAKPLIPGNIRSPMHDVRFISCPKDGINAGIHLR